MIAALAKIRTRRLVERLIREGVGVHERSWDIARGPYADHAETIEGIQHWVWASMATMRRPYGIDHIALALACRDADGQVVLSNSLGILRPSAFYGADGARAIGAFMGDVEAVPDQSRHQVVGALLSLGDLAHAILACEGTFAETQTTSGSAPAAHTDLPAQTRRVMVSPPRTNDHPGAGGSRGSSGSVRTPRQR